MNITNFPKNKDNPFRKEVDKKMMYLKPKGKFEGSSRDLIVSSKSGEYIDSDIAFVKRVLVDEDKFVKLFVNELEHFFNLNNSGIKVLSYVFNQLIPNQDYVLLDLEDCQKFTGYKTKNSVIKGIAELVHNEFIARSERPYKYHINPLIFFNGDRFIFAKRIEKVKKNQGKMFNNNENKHERLQESNSDSQSQ